MTMYSSVVIQQRLRALNSNEKIYYKVKIGDMKSKKMVVEEGGPRASMRRPVCVDPLNDLLPPGFAPPLL